MRHLFIINPTAGKNTDPAALSDEIAVIMAQRQEGYTIVPTRYPHHSEELIREAAEASEEELRVYVFGGDGTLNEAVNGAAGYDHVSLTVYPSGSGNDFLKLFGKTRHLFKDIRALVEGEDREFDLIECNGRMAINLASVGLDARVGVGMTDFKHLPLVSGPMAYVLSLVKNVIGGIHEHYQVTLDGEEMEGDFTLLCVSNGRWYGGSFCPVPDAMPDDGKMTFVLAKAVSRLQVAQLVKAYGNGQGKQFPDLIRMVDGREMIVRSKKPVIAQLDGEKMESECLHFRISDKRIRFAFPKGASYQPGPI